MTGKARCRIIDSGERPRRQPTMAAPLLSRLSGFDIHRRGIYPKICGIKVGRPVQIERTWSAERNLLKPKRADRCASHVESSDRVQSHGARLTHDYVFSLDQFVRLPPPQNLRSPPAPGCPLLFEKFVTETDQNVVTIRWQRISHENFTLEFFFSPSLEINRMSSTLCNDQRTMRQEWQRLLLSRRNASNRARLNL